MPGLFLFLLRGIETPDSGLPYLRPELGDFRRGLFLGGRQKPGQSFQSGRRTDLPTKKEHRRAYDATAVVRNAHQVDHLAAFGRQSSVFMVCADAIRV